MYVRWLGNKAPRSTRGFECALGVQVEMEEGGVETRTRKVDLIVIGIIRSAPRGVISEALGEPCNPGELVLGPPSVCAGV